jgi:hypothetical protein
MEAVSRAKAEAIQAEYARQAQFRSSEDLAICRQVARERFGVTDEHLYLIDILPDQFEDCVTILVWPGAVFKCEIVRNSRALEEVSQGTLEDYRRCARGAHAKHLTIVLAVAESDQRA